MAPCYDRMKALGAVFGQKFGWERPNWFAPRGVPQEDHWSFRRSRWFEHVGEECRNVMENVGLLDMTAFAKARVSGPGAEAFLDHLVANRIPKKAGRLNLCHALNSRGGVHSEFTIQREGRESFYLVSAGAWQRLDHDWLQKHMPTDGSVQFQNLTGAMGVLVVAGPKARTLLERVSDADFSNAAFPWLTGRDVVVGMAPTKALRVNFVGELGWELHHGLEYQNHIFDVLMDAGADLGLKPFGIRAMDSLRIEKSYRLIGTELSIEYAAYESGLDRFVHPNKGEFIGRDALVRWREKGLANRFVTLEVHDVEDADPLGNNPIYANGTLVGRATGGNYGFRLGKSLALAMVRPEHALPGTELAMDILGARHGVTVVPESPYDPENERLKS
jgi:dimethylglycine dehydrogenase